MKTIDLIWKLFKVYLNNPNYYVRQEDELRTLFMRGEKDLIVFLDILQVSYNRYITYGQLLKQLNII